MDMVRTVDTPDRLLVMARAAADATIGTPVDWGALTEGARRVFLDVALAVHRADAILRTHHQSHAQDTNDQMERDFGGTGPNAAR